MNARLNTGSVLSALVTTEDMLSGIATANTPPKNNQAASHPAITTSVVCVNDMNTNVCREYTAVNTNAHTRRRRPDTESTIKPSSPKSICNSRPGTPSATGTVLRGAGVNRSATYRCNVRSGTLTPSRPNNSHIFTTGTSAAAQTFNRS